MNEQRIKDFLIMTCGVELLTEAMEAALGDHILTGNAKRTGKVFQTQLLKLNEFFQPHYEGDDETQRGKNAFSRLIIQFLNNLHKLELEDENALENYYQFLKSYTYERTTPKCTPHAHSGTRALGGSTRPDHSHDLEYNHH